MGLDVRLPIGLLFTVLGTLLTLFGIFSDPALYHRSLDINVNLLWGMVMLAFGVLMLVLGRRSIIGAHSDLKAASSSNQSSHLRK